MKKNDIPRYILLFFFFMLVVYMLYSQTNKQSSRYSVVQKELQDYIANYGNSVYKSFFSLEELRPYSILHTDRLSENYENKWTEPSKMAASLSKKEKDNLLRKVAEFIESSPDESARRRLMLQIKNWCIADLYFGFLGDKLGVKNETLLNSIIENSKTKSLLLKINATGNRNINSLSSIQADEVYTYAVNYVSTLSLKEQMKYYSELMGQLAIASK